MTPSRLLADVAKQLGLTRKALVLQLIELGALDDRERPRNGYRQFFIVVGSQFQLPGYNHYGFNHTTRVTPAGVEFCKQHCQLSNRRAPWTTLSTPATNTTPSCAAQPNAEPC